MSHEKRVVVTGMGFKSPIGHTYNSIKESIISGKSGIISIPEWKKVENLKTMVAGVCTDIDETEIPRQQRRAMGRVAILGTLAAQDAIKDSGLEESEIASPECGVSFGSTEGSSHSMETFLKKVFETNSIKGMPSTSYLQFMSHTCASNIAMMFQAQGPVIASCTACTSGSQGVGFGYQEVQSGRANIMICGGAEEMHFMSAGIFDIMRATSTGYNDSPDLTPRPFDKKRDGLVVGEGGACLILEEYEHAKKRGATIYAEVLGYGTNCDGTHLTNPNPDGMAGAMKIALKDAGVSAEDIKHINAHATATEAGDIAEARAVYSIFKDIVPVTGFKGYMGHLLGGSGAIESIISIIMMREGFVAPTKNLEEVDPECAMINHVRGEVLDLKYNLCMNNNFAFGGINTSLVFKKI